MGINQKMTQGTFFFFFKLLIVKCNQLISVTVKDVGLVRQKAALHDQHMRKAALQILLEALWPQQSFAGTKQPCCSWVAWSWIQPCRAANSRAVEYAGCLLP